MPLYGDLHIHSTYSDGREDPVIIVLEAIKKGLHVISITDHDTFQGSVVAQRLVKERGYPIKVIVGAEKRTFEGDVLVYCPEPIQLPRSLTELSDKALDEGCVVVPAHPYDFLRKGIGEDGLKLLDGRISSIECYNAGCIFPHFNLKAREYALHNNLSCMANSDAHIREYVGIYRTVIHADDEDDVLNAMDKGMVKPIVGNVSYSLISRRFSWSLRRKLGM